MSDAGSAPLKSTPYLGEYLQCVPMTRYGDAPLPQQQQVGGLVTVGQHSGSTYTLLAKAGRETVNYYDRLTGAEVSSDHPGAARYERDGSLHLECRGSPVATEFLHALQSNSTYSGYVRCPTA